MPKVNAAEAGILNNAFSRREAIAFARPSFPPTIPSATPGRRFVNHPVLGTSQLSVKYPTVEETSHIAFFEAKPEDDFRKLREDASQLP